MWQEGWLESFLNCFFEYSLDQCVGRGGGKKRLVLRDILKVGLAKLIDGCGNGRMIKK